MTRYENPDVKRCPLCDAIVEPLDDQEPSSPYTRYSCPTEGCSWWTVAGQRGGAEA